MISFVKDDKFIIRDIEELEDYLERGDLPFKRKYSLDFKYVDFYGIEFELIGDCEGVSEIITKNCKVNFDDETFARYEFSPRFQADVAIEWLRSFKYEVDGIYYQDLKEESIRLKQFSLRVTSLRDFDISWSADSKSSPTVKVEIDRSNPFYHKVVVVTEISREDVATVSVRDKLGIDMCAERLDRCVTKVEECLNTFVLGAWRDSKTQEDKGMVRWIVNISALDFGDLLYNCYNRAGGLR